MFVCLFVIIILESTITTDGGWRKGFQIWRLAANVLNMQSQTADNMWSSIWGVGEGLTTTHRKTYQVTKHFTRPRMWRKNIGWRFSRI